jgi:hypothetical protein
VLAFTIYRLGPKECFKSTRFTITSLSKTISAAKYKGGQMIKNLDSYLKGIVLGIRFRPNFSIEDRLGEIADTILYSKNSIFSPKIFPETETSLEGKTLLNRDTEDNIQINYSNIILDIHFNEKSNFKRQDVPLLLEKYESVILAGVLKKIKVEDIVRIGFVQKYIFEDTTLVKNFIKQTISSNLGDVKDINLRFSKKIPIELSLIKKDVNDYDNVIFNVIKRADKDEIFISLDYQSFYEPFLEDSSSIPYKEFLGKAEKFNSSKFIDWLNNYLMKEEK